MSSSSISASEAEGAGEGAAGRAALRYLALLAALVGAAVLSFLALLALTYGVRINTAPHAAAERLVAKMAYAGTVEGPRLLVFAGSQGFYNLRSERLEAATGRPAVNLATHGSQSLPFLIWQVERVARPGDVVLLPLEHSFYRDGGLTTYGAQMAHGAGLPLFLDLGFEEKVQYLREMHLPRLLKTLASRIGLHDGISQEDLGLTVTPRGDLVPPPQRRGELARTVSAGPPRAGVSTPAPLAEARLSAMIRKAEENGITIVFSPPGVMDPAAVTAEDWGRLRRALAPAGGRYLDLPDGGAIPAEAMLDTSYHAAAAGADLYTAATIEALCGADVAGLACDAGRIADARSTVAAFDAHGLVFGDDPRLETLRKSGLDLAPGEMLEFYVAAFPGCRNSVAVGGAGGLSLRIGGQWQDATPGADGTRLAALPPRRGLVSLALRAGTAGARLESLRRLSDCGRPAADRS